MRRLFFYGTLCHPPLLEAVLGHSVAPQPAVLPDHAVHWVSGQGFPILIDRPGQTAQGITVDLSEADVGRLDFFEGGFDYALTVLPVQTAQGRRAAEVFVTHSPKWTPGAPWDLQDWVARWGAVTVQTASEFMELHGKITPEEARALWPFRLARSWAQHLAQSPAPTTQRHDGGMAEVQLEPRSDGYDNFFGLKRFDLRHKRFDGTWSDQITREGFVAYDAALVLPYDPARDTVLIIEQLRYGPILRTDPHPWVFEPIAGLVDAGEDPKACVLREAREEAGLDLRGVEHMVGVYPSPGYSSEYFHCYLGLADLSRGHGRIAGLASENEDIRSHVMPLDAALALVETGEINAAPLAMMLFWTARHRDRLQAAG